MKAVDIQLCCVIGDPIAHSLSPAMHTAAYQAAQISDRFAFTRARVPANALDRFLEACRFLNMCGISVTLPHKQTVMQYVDALSNAAQALGAVNTIKNDAGRLIGHNTDWHGIVNPLLQRKELKGLEVLVIGAGGAARAAVFGLLQHGAHVTITNRTATNAEKIAQDFNASSVVEINSVDFSSYPIIVQTTSVGMHPHIEASLIPELHIQKDQIIFDTIYNPLETKLLQAAETRGAVTISGVEMFIEQGARQFEMYTGITAPVATMRATVLEELQREYM